MKITDDQFKQIVLEAFDLGETWGVTYSTWFQPSEEDQEKKRGLAVEKCRPLTTAGTQTRIK